MALAKCCQQKQNGSDDGTGDACIAKRDWMTKVVTLADGRKCTLFHSIRSPFSNYHRCFFRVSEKGRQDKPRCFTSSKQFIMYRRAVDSGMTDLAEEIMKQRDLSRVKEFSALMRKKTGGRCTELDFEEIKRGLMAKFTQNDDLRKMLLFTGNSIIAECSGKEKIWGIGLRFTNDRALDVRNWKGTNKTGTMLMAIRAKIREDPRNAAEVEEIDAKWADYEAHINEYFFQTEWNEEKVSSDAETADD